MNTNRRKKRTKDELEKDIIMAALSIIEEKGFADITLTGITKAANVEPSVFYNRFNTLDHCLDEIVRKYDYWFSDIFQDYKRDLYSEDGYKYIFHELFASLSDSKIMQQLLRWELSVNNSTTVRTANLREFHTTPLAENFHKLFENTSIDIRAISSLIVGGVYYLILHGNLTTFSGIDINTQNGKERIINAINYLAKKIFSELSPNNEKIKIAKKLKANRISNAIIAECTDLPLYLIEDL